MIRNRMIRVSDEFLLKWKSQQKEGETLEDTISRVTSNSPKIDIPSESNNSEATSPFALYHSEEEMNEHGFLAKDIVDIDLAKNRIILEKNGGGTWFYSFKKGEILETTLSLLRQRKTDDTWNDILGQACFKRGTGKQLSLVEIRV